MPQVLSRARGPRFAAALLCLAFLVPASADRGPSAGSGDSESPGSAYRSPSAIEIIRELSGPAYEGRQAGSPGGRKAGDYLESLLRREGLEVKEIAFRERAPVYVRQPRFAVEVPGSPTRELEFRRDYRDGVNGAWIEPSARGRLVLLAGTDSSFPRGSVVVLSGEGYDNAVDGSFLERGAAGLVLILDPVAVERRATYPGQAPMLLASPRRGLVKMVVSSALVPYLSKAAAAGAVASLTNPVGFEDRDCRDLVASWNGDGGGFKPGLLFCAHYDHVGAELGGAIFPGALDNASGAALVVELAGRAAREGLRRDLAFLLTDAEEINLSGASAFVSAPGFPLAGIQAVNLDMLGGGGPLPINLDSNGDGPSGELARVLGEALARAGFTTREAVVPNVDSGPLGYAGAAAVTLCELDESVYHTKRDGPGGISEAELAALEDALYAFASAGGR